MPSFNKVFLMGNLTREPEVRSLPGGQTVCEFGIASNRTYMAGGQGGQGGEKKEEVTFVDVTFWGRRGEVIAQYFHKGDPIFLEGRLTYRQWEDKNGGGKRSKLTVTGDNFEFINSGSRQGGGGGGGGGGRQSGGGGGGGFEMPSGGGGDAMEGFDEVPF